MSVTLSSLRAAHPEFTDTPDAVLSAAIVSAENRCDAEVWGVLYDDGVTLFACHIAAATPYGAGGRLTAPDFRSVYYRDWEQMARAVGTSWRIA
jgi:hypothetical protein